MARDVQVRQEQWRDVWKKARVKNQGNKTTHNTPGLIANITRCLQKMETTFEDAFAISLTDTKQISLMKREDRKIKHELREALTDARWRMITQKDFREDAAKVVGKAASLNMLRSKQLTQWQKSQLRAINVSGIWTFLLCSKREGWLVACAQHVERNQKHKITCGDARRKSSEENHCSHRLRCSSR